MTRHVRIAAELLLVPTIALGVALALAPDRAALEVHVWLLVVLCVGSLAFVGAVGAAYPRAASPFAASLRRPERPAERPAPLVRLERMVTMAGSSAFDVHFRLRPAVTDLAAELLSSRQGIDFAREPERARKVLGEDVWELVAPDRGPPLERHGAGIEEARLESVVAALEQV